MARSTRSRIQLDNGAWLYKQPGGTVWYLDLTASGRRKRFSLKTHVQERAREIAQQELERARAHQWGLPVFSDVSFVEFLKTYVEHAKVRNTERTIELNVKNLERFRAFAVTTLGKDREPKLSEVTPEMIEAYITQRKAPRIRLAEEGKPEGEPRCVSPTTINRELGTLSVFFNFAKERGNVRYNPMDRIAHLPSPKRFPRTLTIAQVQKLMEAAGGPVPCHGRGGKGKGNSRDRLTPLRDMILFAANTGARLGEILYMEWNDIDLEEGIVFFRNKPDHRIKDHADRRIKANEAVLKMLSQRKLTAGKNRWVFPSVEGKVIDRANALRELSGAASRAKVEGVNWQILRRTFLTCCANRGTPPFILKELAGHSSIRTTETFYIGAGGGGNWVPPVIGA